MCKICGFNSKKIELNNILYHKCECCGFLYKDNQHLLSNDEEFDRYRLHNNNDDTYIAYQTNFFNEIETYLNGKILDFGCGDNHILANIISENCYDCNYYDLYFYNNDALKNIYDVIILEEVIEHLKDPLKVLKDLNLILNKNGLFIIRTNLIHEGINLNSWWYLRDKTHISFFTLKTFETLCELLDLKIIYCNRKDLTILKKV